MTLSRILIICIVGKGDREFKQTILKFPFHEIYFLITHFTVFAVQRSWRSFAVHIRYMAADEPLSCSVPAAGSCSRHPVDSPAHDGGGLPGSVRTLD